MKDGTFKGKERISIVVFLQDFKAECDFCNIHKRETMSILKHYLNSQVESFIEASVALPTKTTRAQEGYLKSYSAIVN